MKRTGNGSHHPITPLPSGNLDEDPTITFEFGGSHVVWHCSWDGFPDFDGRVVLTAYGPSSTVFYASDTGDSGGPWPEEIDMGSIGEPGSWLIKAYVANLDGEKVFELPDATAVA